MVEVLASQAKRAGRIVQSFLSLATKTEPAKQAVGVNDIVRNVLKLREYDYTVRDIFVSCDLMPGLPNAIGDASQIESYCQEWCLGD